MRERKREREKERKREREKERKREREGERTNLCVITVVATSRVK